MAGKQPPSEDRPFVSRRITWQKQAVHDHVLHRHDHPTAKAVHQELKHMGIGLATVYRNLALMVEDGMLSTVEHEGELRYDCNNQPHAHATCQSCGAIWDVPLPFDHENLSVTGLHTVSNVDFTLQGQCTGCAS